MNPSAMGTKKTTGVRSQAETVMTAIAHRALTTTLDVTLNGVPDAAGRRLAVTASIRGAEDGLT
jgi:hypothetical protein